MIQVCQSFLQKAGKVGIEWQVGENDGIWRGNQRVGKWSSDDLSRRKQNVNWWIGTWKDPAVGLTP